jgi:hypothetical protein
MFGTLPGGLQNQRFSPQLAMTLRLIVLTGVLGSTIGNSTALGGPPIATALGESTGTRVFRPRGPRRIVAAGQGSWRSSQDPDRFQANL